MYQNVQLGSINKVYLDVPGADLVAGKGTVPGRGITRQVFANVTMTPLRFVIKNDFARWNVVERVFT